MQLFKICLLLFMPLGITAQNINIPDQNFKNALLNTLCVDRDGDGVFESNADLNSDGEINQSEALAVIRLNVDSSNIDSLNGLEAFINLVHLDCSNNEIRKLDVKHFSELEYLNCSYNWVDTFEVENLQNLKELNCSFNFLVDFKANNLGQLTYLDMSRNRIQGQIAFQGLPSLETLNCASNRNYRLSTKGLGNLKRLETNDCYLNKLLNLDEAPNLEYLRCDKNELTELDLSPLTKLKYLNFEENLLVSADVRHISDLEVLLCHRNELIELQVDNLSKLIELGCADNHIAVLDLKGCIGLKELVCARNVLRELDFRDSKDIEFVLCRSNNIFHIDAHDLKQLKYLRCQYNKLSTLNVRGCTNLFELSCSDNNLQEIDLQDAYNLTRFYCSSNFLKYLLIKNGNRLEDFSFQLVDDAYICCDTVELDTIVNFLEARNIENYHINEYCSFYSGGPLEQIRGEQILDMDKNGCDANDMRIQSPELRISNGSSVASLAFPNTPEYYHALSPGSYELSMDITHPTYFDIQPRNYQLNLPSGNPTDYNFCITPVGERHNVTIDFIPISTTQPGFVGDYQIVVSNTGNEIESGRVQLEYEEALMDFVSSSQLPSQQGNGILEWIFDDLQPFEKQVIDCSLQANTPMQVPPLNNGDSLLFVANVKIPQDEYPSNNIDLHRELVVGSYDPNDKTCLNGLSIAPDEVGEYLSYLIRFENTGTAPARNVVVKDSIDRRTLDITTLEVINASHALRTRTNDGDVVEFIFENIDLPFEDATNDGFVAFKIKTKPSLTLGDSIKNKAEIYFDFNFPIITNEAQTVVQLPIVDTEEMIENSEFIEIYPNPTTGLLFVKNTKKDEKLHRIEIFDASGSLLRRKLIVVNQVDVSNLPKGVYFVKLHGKLNVYTDVFIKTE